MSDFESDKNFVSRAGVKLEAAMEYFNIDISNRVCADLGCSTGGFTDCLLQRGARKVFSVDTAYGELAWKLRTDSRVVVMEKQNALFVHFPEKVAFISVDVGWTKQTLIIKKALDLLEPGGQIISLIKPHYEADKKLLVKGRLPDEYALGVVTSTIQNLNSLISDLAEISGYIKSPIVGDKAKNSEYLMLVKKKMSSNF